MRIRDGLISKTKVITYLLAEGQHATIGVDHSERVWNAQEVHHDVLPVPGTRFNEPHDRPLAPILSPPVQLGSCRLQSFGTAQFDARQSTELQPNGYVNIVFQRSSL